MACPGKKNVLKKHQEKVQKYQQLAFDVRVRERRPGYRRMGVVLIVIGCMDGGVRVMREQVRKILINSVTYKVCREMLRMAVMEWESILRKVIINILIGD